MQAACGESLIEGIFGYLTPQSVDIPVVGGREGRGTGAGRKRRFGVWGLGFRV